MLVKLSNGKFVAGSAVEISAFPAAEIVAQDMKSAQLKVSEAFSKIVFEFHKMSEINTTAMELLWLTESVDNQTFKSKVRLFVVLRKIGMNAELTESSVQMIQDNVISTLTQLKYETRTIDLTDKIFLELVKRTNCSSSFSVVKKEKLVSSSTLGNAFYSWDVLNSNSEDPMSDFVNTLSKCENCAVSFQMIPASLNDNEINTLNELSSQYQQILSGFSSGGQIIKDSSVEKPFKTVQYVIDNAKRPLFYYNVCTFGNANDCRIVATKLLSLLQSGKTNVSDCDLMCLDISRESISINEHFFVYPWMLNEKITRKYRDLSLQQFPIIRMLSRMPYLMTSEELSVFYRVPIYGKSTPALTQKRGAGDVEQFDASIFGENTIKIGKLMSNENSNIEIGVPLKPWTQHALVVGMPGTGKTTFSVNILTQFAKKRIPFLAIEPTKTEYRAMIDAIEDLQIFTPGNNAVSPFIINPFIPPKGITVEQYIPSLLNAFKAAFPMDGPLEMIFLKSINACYIEYGWKQDSKYGDLGTVPFGMYEYILCFKKIMKTMKYNKDTQTNIETAGLLRLMNLIEQNSNIYDTVNTIPIEDLLCKPTVLELNAIENDEQKALIMALLLSSISVHTKNNQKGDGELKNVILIDEAHVLLDVGDASGDSGNARFATVRTVQKMIAEIRSYGTSIIIADQKPSSVTESVVGNTNVKIAFRLTAGKERKIIAETTDMTEADSNFIPKLGVGQAFVHFDKLDAPQLIQTEDTRKRDGIRLSVSNEEIAERSMYWKDKMQNLIPFRECDCSPVCNLCSFKIRNDAEFFASKLLNSCSSKISDKKTLITYACKIPSVLQKQSLKYADKEKQQLYNCTIIKFIRKARLSLPYTVTQAEFKKIIELSRRGL